ncbi:hypothetical protein ABI138_01835 [Faecalibacterium prausnitzii]|uniref:Uncharacterized protein n=1 Tax=Faecalibacterium wellingii TaxID=2929491 RepID=A0AB35Y553_9FIRM
MKLFKKLAAAALAAVLALSMVGCGAGGTGSALDLKNEVLNLVEDTYYMSGKTATHTTAMDTEAAKLIESAANAGAEEGNNNTVQELLQKYDKGNYIAIFAPQLRTEMMQNAYIQKMNMALSAVTKGESSYDEMIVKIGTPAVGKGDSIEMGAATGTIKGKNYLVLLVKKAA